MCLAEKYLSINSWSEGRHVEWGSTFQHRRMRDDLTVRYQNLRGINRMDTEKLVPSVGDISNQGTKPQNNSLAQNCADGVFEYIQGGDWLMFK